MKPRTAVELLLVLALASLSASASARVAGSKHDLSARGAARGASRICVFCHTPHVSAPAVPAWNRSEPTLLYTPYSSPTLQASVGQPTGTSKICLSCHDGTIALSAVPSPTGQLFGPYPLPGRSNLTSDLSDDHPVSFTYDPALVAQDPELVNPTALPSEIWLDKNDQMQCTSCHDPHAGTYPNFLVMENTYSRLCTACHDKKGWSRSSHASSSASWNGSGTDPWPYTEEESVAANGCASCHTAHSAGIAESLLVFPQEEDNCLSCHDGSTASSDIAAEMRKPSRHPVDGYSGLHVAVEDPDSMPRHVECQDCHDPHAAYAGTASAPYLAAPLAGVPGVSSSGAPTESARYEYEVCFRCHADGPEVPAPYVERQILQPNIRMKFDVRNPSFHPVEESGQNPDVPSLIFPLNETSIIYCTDCHSSDASRGGSERRGPHGSIWPFLLEQEYNTSDGTSESYDAYALCYKCHDRDVVLSNRSFPMHEKHVVDDNTPCSVCHDPHGISATQGNFTNNTHLINFDISIVEPVPTGGVNAGELMFEDLGANRGRCYVACHGVVHDGVEY